MGAMGAIAAVVLSITSAGVAAQSPVASYPNRPIRFVVGFAAGGPTDVIARITGQDMSAALGQTVVVENRAGANAQIATELVARATPDGHTLLYSSLSLLVNAILLEGKARYDPFKDFAPIGQAAVLPMVVVTSPATKLNTLQELLAAAKAKPGAITYGAPGHGGSGHLAGALLENLSGAKMTTIPFRGNAPALTDVMAGQVTYMFYPIIGIAEQVAGKRLKVLGPIWEVRSNLGNRIARILFAVESGAMVLLHGFIKKTQQTPTADIALALKRFREWHHGEN